MQIQSVGPAPSTTRSTSSHCSRRGAGGRFTCGRGFGAAVETRACAGTLPAFRLGRNVPAQGINRMGYVAVPLYDTLGDAAVAYVVEHAEVGHPGDGPGDPSGLHMRCGRSGASQQQAAGRAPPTCGLSSPQGTHARARTQHLHPHKRLRLAPASFPALREGARRAVRREQAGGSGQDRRAARGRGCGGAAGGGLLGRRAGRRTAGGRARRRAVAHCSGGGRCLDGAGPHRAGPAEVRRCSLRAAPGLLAAARRPACRQPLFPSHPPSISRPLLAPQAVADAGAQVTSWGDLLEAGKAAPQPAQAPAAEDLCTIMYTSGTTGGHLCM